MTEQIALIASRLKELREIAGISAESLANELQIEKELLQRYEGGLTDIPVGFLYKVAHRFGLELTALLSGDQPRLHVYAVVRKGRGLAVNRRQPYGYESLGYNFVHKNIEPFIVTVSPDEDKQPEQNIHPGQEFNFVLEGTLMVTIDGHDVTLNEGDAIYFDSGYRHGMKALSGKQARFLAIVTDPVSKKETANH